ncbi:cyanophycin synthetase [Flaviaesturariibacter flavus]|uniref:Cyanophycin synthetase n=1 Tax=Flaviaesturariibacter flavus TaxID=2502780 RepID=A0A4R1B889_9BACT|nr:cyanophycin synthetase [Flaviaesturariibacter flavus]TCJ12059.1 cyanophycin synthetase [Flaviaesturariibacter flavus]
MLLKSMNVLRGPNFWSMQHHQLIVLHLDLQPLLETQSAHIPQLAAALKEVLPGISRRTFTPGRGDGLLSLPPGQVLCELIVSAALELQQQAGMTAFFSDVLATGGKPGEYQAAFMYCEEPCGRLAGTTAVALLEALLTGQPYDLGPVIDELRVLREDVAFGPSTASLVLEARRRRIPIIRLDDGAYVQLGYGARQQRIEATITGRTSGIAIDKAGDKQATKQLLSDAFIPVPNGTVLRHVENLPEAIAELGFPIVVKPLDGHQGKGATVNIRTEAAAREAFAKALLYSNRVLIERYIYGSDFRALVINNRFVAAARRTPAAVFGDGLHTIAQLVEEVNRDPRRGNGHANVLTKICIDGASLELLARKGYTLDTVPKEGEEVHLKSTANLSTGGTAEDITGRVHPQNIRLFERVARIISLDICGIDIMAPDLSTPIMTNGGAIIEVNAAPGFRMHLDPTFGEPRNVAAPVLDMLFPEGGTGRIPVVAVTGTNGKTTTTRLIAQMARQGGFNTGLTTTDGIYLNGDLIYKGDCSGPASAQAVLKDTSVEFAVLECARGGILRSGLGFDSSDVAVITNIAEDHLGLGGIYDLEALARVKGVVAASVRPGGHVILNADDDRVYAMRNFVQGEVVLFSLHADNIRVQRHCEAGGLAATYDEGYIMIRKGNQLIPIEAVENVPIAFGGAARFNIANVLGATLAAYVSGISMPAIRCVLRRFRNSTEDTPGRMNHFNVGEVTVLVDYAHNAHGLRALGEYVRAARAERRLGVITGVGDRRNEDIIAMGAESARIFDEIVIRCDVDLRGRTEFEIASLLRSGIMNANPYMKVAYCPDELEAVGYALGKAQPGDLVVILVENVQQVIARLKELAHKQVTAMAG